MDGTHDSVPRFNKVGTASITKDTEGVLRGSPEVHEVVAEMRAVIDIYPEQKNGLGKRIQNPAPSRI
jgi:hypothetical protein